MGIINGIVQNAVTQALIGRIEELERQIYELKYRIKEYEIEHRQKIIGEWEAI